MKQEKQEKPEFISAYQGASDYRFAGERYRVRYRAYDDGQYNPGVFHNEVLPAVGTVRRVLHGDYPPEELMAFFPGYVASRYNRDKKGLEHAAEPRVAEVPYWKGKAWVALAILEEARIPTSRQGFIASVCREGGDKT